MQQMVYEEKKTALISLMLRFNLSDLVLDTKGFRRTVADRDDDLILA